MGVRPAKGGVVDPVALIMAALTAGAGSAVQEETPDAVKGAYVRLRDVVRRRLAGHRDGELALARHEADPRAGQAPLARALARAGAGDDAELVARARELMELIDGAGKYAVFAPGAQGVQVGDRTTQVNNYFVQGLASRQAGVADGKPAGRPLGEVTDPFALEVHRPVRPDASAPGLAALPAYVAREHDAELAGVVAAAAAGASGIAVLVGGSSTGKTRACWEALGLLRERPEGWRVWHPIDPARPEAALRELPSVGPRTVVWLNEAQFYLDDADGLGERIAAGLREALRDPARAPVLVLATLWPEHWGALTARSSARSDLHEQARELLAGRDIRVPTAFTGDQLQLLPAAGDPRLALAMQAAESGQITQFLAGAPVLMARYRNAPPAAAALISAAMDARRLGMGLALPVTFLEQAAPGYLTDAEWDGLGEDWLDRALAYTDAPAEGIRGPLARVRPRPAASDGPASGPDYRLADYLEQHGRRDRRALIPPAGFWEAAVRCAAPADLPALAGAAANRGLLRDAARLRKRAVAHGNVKEAVILVGDWQRDHPHTAGRGPAEWAVTHVSLDDPYFVAMLLDGMRRAGAEQQVTALLARDPATRVSLDYLHGVAMLLDSMRAAGAERQLTALANRAADHVPLNNRGGPAFLLDHMWRAGADQQVTALAARLAAHVSLDDPYSVATLLDHMRRAGADQQVTALLARDPAAHVLLDDPRLVGGLLGSMRAAGAEQQVTVLATRAADHAPLDEPHKVMDLLDSMRAAGADQQVTALATRVAAHVSLSDPHCVATSLNHMRRAGADQQVTALLARDPAAHVPIADLFGITVLLDSMREAGAEQQVTALATRVAAHAPLDEPYNVAHLLNSMRRAGADQQVTALATRAAAHAPLDGVGLGFLLDTMREAGAEQQVTVLAARAAEHAPLDKPYNVAPLLNSMRAAGAEQQLTTLLARDPAAQVCLDSPGPIADLLDSMREAGAEQQVTALATRTAAHASLPDALDEASIAIRGRRGVADLLDSMRKAGAEQQAKALVDRLPAEGLFRLFREKSEHPTRYRFGYEPDGNPAPPWGWDDLD